MRALFKLVLFVFGLIVVIVILASAFGGHSNTTASNTGTGNSGANSGNSGIETTIPVTYTNVTIVPSTQGSGESSMAAFTIPDDANAWYLGWSYACGADVDDSGNFIVNVQGVGDTETTDLGVNQLGAGGHSVETYYDTGTFQLVINSECNWAIKVTASEPS